MDFVNSLMKRPYRANLRLLSAFNQQLKAQIPLFRSFSIYVELVYNKGKRLERRCCMNEPFVHKLFVGKVKEINTKDIGSSIDKDWKTGMCKEPIEEQVWLSKTGLEGDEVADKKNHGGPEKALFVYPIQHYTYWRDVAGLKHLDMGAMGENLSVLEMDEYSVYIGDTYTFGDAIIQVSQPRIPCWKPGARAGVDDLALQINQTGRSGWYFRVLEEGHVLSRIDIELIHRPYPQWSIAACQEVVNHPTANLRRAYDLLECDVLADGWKRRLRKKLFGRP